MKQRTTRRRGTPRRDYLHLLFFDRATAHQLPLDPLHADVPALRNAEIAAIYQGYRVAGDFYEFLRVSPTRVLFGLFDIAGRREDTRQVLIAAQHIFRTLAPRLFASENVNECEAMIELSQQINRTILQFEGGVRSCPAFLGCYNEDVRTVCYANAGHTPGLLRDATGITRLDATGLPLGLFSHHPRRIHGFAGSRSGSSRCLARHRRSRKRWGRIRPRRRKRNSAASVRKYGSGDVLNDSPRRPATHGNRTNPQ